MNICLCCGRGIGGGSLCEECEKLSAFRKLEQQAERVLTIREVFEYGFKAGLSRAGLTSRADEDYELWLWSREATQTRRPHPEGQE